MTVRRTFQWLVVLVLLIGAAGLGSAWWMFAGSDEMLRKAVLDQLAAKAPGWRFGIGRARFDWQRRVHLSDVTLHVPGRTEPTVHVGEVVITVDRERFQAEQAIDVRRVELHGATVRAERDESGCWDFEALPPLPPPDTSLPCPEWIVEEGRLEIRLQRKRVPSNAPRTWILAHTSLHLVPSSKRHFDVRATTQFEEGGTLAATGRFGLDERSWSGDVTVSDLPGGPPLVELLCEASPELHVRLATADRDLRRFAESGSHAVAESDEPEAAHTPEALVGRGPPMRVAVQTADGSPLPRPGRIAGTTATQRGGGPGPEGRFAAASGPESGAPPDPPGAPLRDVGPTSMSVPPRDAPANDAGVRAAAARAAAAGLPIPDFGTTGTLDVQVHVEYWQPGVEPRFRLAVDLKGGRCEHPALPYSLHDLVGHFAWDNADWLVRGVSARHGSTTLRVDGRVPRATDGPGPRFDVAVTDLVLEEPILRRLPQRIRKAAVQLDASGRFDVSLSIAGAGPGRWRTEGLQAEVRDGSAAHVLFPYRVRNVSGTIRQQEGDFVFDFRGTGGLRPVTAKGLVRGTGPEAESLFEIRTRQMPIDSTLLAACPAAVRSVLESLRLEGQGDVVLKLHRPPGLDRRFATRLEATLASGSMECSQFPYRLAELSGRVEYDSESRIWSFLDVQARHTGALLAARGNFVQGPIGNPGRLVLDVAARGAPLDTSLHAALPESMRNLWTKLAPAGTLDCDVRFEWSPGEPAVVALPRAAVRGGRMVLTAFPYEWSDVEARFSYTGNRVVVTNLTGRHDQTKFRGHGFAETDPTGEWRIRLTEFDVDDLEPGRELRRALPAGLRTAVEELDPKGPVSLSGMLELRGTDEPTDPVTAAWDLALVLAGNTFNAGPEVRGAHGRCAVRGTWDGEHVVCVGDVDLDSAIVLDYHLARVRGPFELHDRQLVVGSRDAFVPGSRTIASEDHLTAQAIDGVLALDAAVVLQDETSYHFKLALSQGKLEEYARLYLPGTTNLRGVMNGWVDLHGRGRSLDQLAGHGQLQISPAALYELPVVAQMFKVLSLASPDRTAFTYAFLDFDVSRSQFLFETIDLVGDTVSLRGRGSARFDGRLQLDFFSMLSRNQLAIPVVGALIGEATKGWVGVEVRGQTSAPVVRVKAVPQLDDGLRRFLGAFDPRPTGPIPRLAIPRPALPTLGNGQGTPLLPFPTPRVPNLMGPMRPPR